MGTIFFYFIYLLFHRYIILFIYYFIDIISQPTLPECALHVQCNAQHAALYCRVL